jgi:hypothetical protein
MNTFMGQKINGLEDRKMWFVLGYFILYTKDFSSLMQMQLILQICGSSRIQFARYFMYTGFRIFFDICSCSFGSVGIALNVETYNRKWPFLLRRNTFSNWSQQRTTSNCIWFDVSSRFGVWWNSMESKASR